MYNTKQKQLEQQFLKDSNVAAPVTLSDKWFHKTALDKRNSFYQNW